MDQKTLAYYREFRREHCISANLALAWARSRATNPLYGELELDENGRAQVDVEGITFRISLQVDEYPDLSWLGEFTDKWSPDAIDRQAAGTCERGQYRYYLPCRDTVFDRQALSDGGHSRHAADCMARGYRLRDWRRMEGGITSFVVSVEVIADGQCIGSDVVGGVEFVDHWPTDSELASFLWNDMCLNAAADALEHTKRVRSSAVAARLEALNLKWGMR